MKVFWAGLRRGLKNEILRRCLKYPEFTWVKRFQAPVTFNHSGEDLTNKADKNSRKELCESMFPRALTPCRQSLGALRMLNHRITIVVGVNDGYCVVSRSIQQDMITP